MSRERPILFNAPMVRAILDGRKTQTRRVVKQKHLPWLANILGNFLDGKWNQRPLPYGQPGDRLWVRETHAQVFEVDILAGRPVGPIGTAGSPARPEWKSRYVYLADGEMPNVQWHHVGDSQPVRWTPSIHMPRSASRITLEIVSVRVERLQDISEADAKAEGAEPYRLPVHPARESIRHVDGFCALWTSINGPGSWDANPWVWVVEFKRVTPP